MKVVFEVWKEDGDCRLSLPLFARGLVRVKKISIFCIHLDTILYLFVFLILLHEIMEQEEINLFCV